MTPLTVVLCPPGPGDDAPAWAARLDDVVRLEPAPRGADAPGWVAHTALALPDAPALLVAAGAACALVPSVGFAARAARRPLRGYLLVHGELPSASERSADWPDAPVAVVAPAESAAAAQAHLRGWAVLGDDPVRAIAAMLELL